MEASLADLMADLKEEDVLTRVRGLLAQAKPALGIIEQCREGLNVVGERFAQKEYFLAELIMSAEIFQEVMALTKPYLLAQPMGGPAPIVVLGTVRGDIHDMGKNIVSAILSASGFQVEDLGVDVLPEAFVKKVRETGAPVVGLSALLTTSLPWMKATVDELTQNKLRPQVKVMVGGAVVNDSVRENIGADFYGKDAVSAMKYCKSIIGQSHAP